MPENDQGGSRTLTIFHGVWSVGLFVKRAAVN